MYHVVLLNGPKHSGKDTLVRDVMWFGHALAPVGKHRVHFVHDKFSLPLKAGLAAFFDISQEELDDVKDTPHFGDNKVTGRQAQIGLSEDYAKKLFGEKIFGQLLAQRIKKIASIHTNRNYDVVFLISDSGFNIELETLIEELGPNTIDVVRLYRPGTSFAGDSRGRISSPHLISYQLYNNGPMKQTVKDFYEILDDILKRRHGDEGSD